MEGEVEASAWLVQQDLHTRAVLQPSELAHTAAAAAASALSMNALQSASPSVPCCAGTAPVMQMQLVLAAVVAQPPAAATICLVQSLVW